MKAKKRKKSAAKSKPATKITAAKIKVSKLGLKFRQLRRARGFTQRRLAELAGVSNDYISKIEKGKNTNIGIQTLQRIADAMMVNPFELQSTANLTEKAIHPEKFIATEGFEFKADSSTRDLLKLWSKLDRSDRKVILNVAKQLARS